MVYRKTNHGYLIKLARDERLFEEIEKFCVEHGIRSAIFHAIGAVKNTTMGYYDLEKREYFFTDYPDDMEVVAMNGNVVTLEGGPFIHVHGVLSDTKNVAHGGHIKRAEVAVTLEVFLQDLGEEITRVHDDDIGLKLLNL